MSAERQNRGLVLHGPREARVESIDMPRPGPRDVLVEMRLVGICGSDVHFFEHAKIGPFVVERPMVLGHEPYGVVAEVGSQATRHRIGDRVAIEPGVPCGRCSECRRGRYNLCRDVTFLAVPPQDGALARYVAIDESFAHPVPDSLPDEHAAMIEPLAVSLYAVERGGVRPGSKVLITGAGPIGLLALECAHVSGATEVAVTDVRPHALETATELGASYTRAFDPRLSDGTEELPFEPDVHLECSGAAAAMRAGIEALAPGGTCVLVGVGPESTEIPVARIRRRELVLTATFRYANAFGPAIDLAASGRLDLDRLITDRYTLEDAVDAFDAALDRGSSPTSGSETIKALVEIRV